MDELYLLYYPAFQLHIIRGKTQIADPVTNLDLLIDSVYNLLWHDGSTIWI